MVSHCIFVDIQTIYYFETILLTYSGYYPKDITNSTQIDINDSITSPQNESVFTQKKTLLWKTNTVSFMKVLATHIKHESIKIISGTKFTMK